jgi:hypothetical protein
MKIFGKKRKRSKIEDELEQQQQLVAKQLAEESVIKIIQEKDPSTWNAKERRLVKRYQDRVNAEEEASQGPQHDEKEVEEVEVAEEENEDSDASENSDVESNATEDIADDDDEEEKVENATDLSPVVENANVDSQLPEENSKENPTADGLSSDAKTLLDQLPSKQRRKLMRQFERNEVSAEKVVELAKEMLQIANPDAPENRETPDQPKAKRRKKNSIDDKDLTPDERARRQEQRRLQQEAAEKRAKGEVSKKHGHPLNSERRRANRRKPKWQKKDAVSFKTEHASSGYHIRKATKA